MLLCFVEMGALCSSSHRGAITLTLGVSLLGACLHSLRQPQLAHHPLNHPLHLLTQHSSINNQQSTVNTHHSISLTQNHLHNVINNNFDVTQTLEQEGAAIVAFKLVRRGEFQEEGISELLRAPARIPGNFGTRNLSDNLSDLHAQVAANFRGAALMHELVRFNDIAPLVPLHPFNQRC